MQARPSGPWQESGGIVDEYWFDEGTLMSNPGVELCEGGECDYATSEVSHCTVDAMDDYAYTWL